MLKNEENVNMSSKGMTVVQIRGKGTENIFLLYKLRRNWRGSSSDEIDLVVC